MCVTINISTMLKTNSFVGGGSARYEAPSILTLELLSESTVLNGSNGNPDIAGDDVSDESDRWN